MDNNVIATGFIVLVCISAIVLESKRKPRAAGKILWLEHGLTYKAIGLIGPAVTAYIIANELSSGRPIKAVILGSVFAAMNVPIFLLAFFWRVGYDQSGLYCYSPWRATRKVAWDEIKAVRFSAPLKHWIILTNTKGSVRINQLIAGTEGLVEEIRSRGIR